MRNRFTIDTDLVFHGNNNDSKDSDPPSSPLSQHALLQSPKPQGEDTDRWVEEQFDLGGYEERGEEGVNVAQVKETDILSDDDEYCKSVRASSAEPADLEGKVERLDLREQEVRRHEVNGGTETGSGGEIVKSTVLEEEGDAFQRGDDLDSVDSLHFCAVPLSLCAAPNMKLAPPTQCAVDGEGDVIWVRRDDFANGCNSDIF